MEQWRKIFPNRTKYASLGSEVGIELILQERRWIDKRFKQSNYSAIEFVIRLEREHAFKHTHHVEEDAYRSLVNFHRMNKISFPFSRKLVQEHIINSSDTAVIMGEISAMSDVKNGYFRIPTLSKKPMPEWLDFLTDFFPTMDIRKGGIIRLNVNQNGIMDSYSRIGIGDSISAINTKSPILCHIKDSFYEKGAISTVNIDDFETDNIITADANRGAGDEVHSFALPNISDIVVHPPIIGLKHIRIPSNKVSIRSDRIKIVSEILLYTYRPNIEYTVNGNPLEEFLIRKIVYSLENKHDIESHQEMIEAILLLPSDIKSLILHDSRIESRKSRVVNGLLTSKRVNDAVNSRSTVFERLISATNIYPIASDTDSRGTRRYFFHNVASGTFIKSAITPNEIRKNIVPHLGGANHIVAEYYGKTPSIEEFARIEKSAMRELTEIYIDSSIDVQKLQGTLSVGVHRIGNSIIANTGVNLISAEEDIDFHGYIPIFNNCPSANIFMKQKNASKLKIMKWKRLVSNLKCFLAHEEEAEILAASLIAMLLLPVTRMCSTTVVNLFNSNPKRMDQFHANIFQQSLLAVYQYKNKIGDLPKGIQDGTTFPISLYNTKGKNTSFLKSVSARVPIDANDDTMRHGALKSSAPLISFGVRQIVGDSYVLNYRLRSDINTDGVVEADDLTCDIVNYAMHFTQAIGLAERRMFLLQNRKSVQKFGFRKSKLNIIFKAIAPTLLVLEFFGYDKMEKAIPILLEKFRPHD